MRTTFLVLLTLLSVSVFGKSLTTLRSDLELAKLELEEAKERVIQLQDEIASEEIDRIKREFAKYEEEETAMKDLLTNKEHIAFFAEQRETLEDIIYNHPTHSIEAETIMDEILRFITFVGDQD